MPHDGVRPDGGWQDTGADPPESTTSHDEAEQQEETPSQVATQTGSASDDVWRNHLMGLPTEILEPCVQMITDPEDLRSLTLVNNKRLRQMSMCWRLQVDENTRTLALQWACKKGDNPLVRRLIEYGAQVDQTWSPRETNLLIREEMYPLAAAIAHHHVGLVEALLKEHGANPQGPNIRQSSQTDSRSSRSPLDHALDPNFFSPVQMDKDVRFHIIRMLLDHEALPNPAEAVGHDMDDLPISLALTNDDVPASLLERMLSMSSDFRVPADPWEAGALGGFYNHFIAKARAMAGPGKRLTSTQAEKLKLILSDHWVTGQDPSNSRQSPIVMAVDCLIVQRQNFLGWRSSKECDERSEYIIGQFETLFDAGLDVKESETPSTNPPYHEDQWGSYSTAIACLCRDGDWGEFPVGRIINLLIKRGVSVNAKDHHGYTALHYASIPALVDRMKQLLDHGADPNVATKDDAQTALHFVTDGRYHIVYNKWHEMIQKRTYAARLLLEAGADATAPADGDGLSPLHHACSSGFQGIVRLLLRAGADPTLADRDGFLPLHHACQTGHRNVVRLLIKAGADPTHANRDGSLPLHKACQNSRETIARLLIKEGADPTRADRDGFLPLHYACRYGSVDVVRFLIRACASDLACLHATANDLSTPLHCAAQKFCESRSPAASEADAESDAEADADADGASFSDSDSDTDDSDELDFANSEEAENYFRYGTYSSPVDYIDDDGEAEQVEIVKMLVQRGADPKALDADGRMPIAYARRFRFWELADVLKDCGGDDGFGTG